MTSVAPATTTDRFELYRDGALVASVGWLESGVLCCLEWVDDHFVLLELRFTSAASARRHLRRRAGGGEWYVAVA